MRSIFTLLLIIAFSSLTNAQKYERYVKLIDTSFVSKNLGYSKNITLTVPMEWQKNISNEFPLIIVFDKQNARSHQFILNSIDYLTSNEQIPASILVSIESDQDKRAFETLYKASHENGLAAENEAFLFEELIPMLENKFNASKFRLFIGHSRYGYFTSSLLVNRPQELNAIISISPFYTQKNINLIDTLRSMQKDTFQSLKFYRFGMGNDFQDSYQSIDSALSVLQIKNLDAKGYNFPLADHNATPGLMINTALYDIFKTWTYFQNLYLDEQATNFQTIDSLQSEIKKNYGENLRFSIGVLNGKGWQFYGNEQYELAISAWEVLLKNYPNFVDAYLYIIDAQKMLKHDYSSTVLRFKSELKKSEIYTKKQKQDLLKELEKQ